MIELLVAISLFTVVVTIAVGGFTRALRAQEQVKGFLAASGNASLALEQMAREIRTGVNLSCAGGVKCAALAPTPELNFTNAGGEDVTYCLFSGALERGVGSGISCGDANFEKITNEDVAVEYLSFYLHGHSNGDEYPPRVTITLGVRPIDPTVASFTTDLQTTVSARTLDQ